MWSLQVNSENWLVKTFVIPNECGWVKTELFYEGRNMVKKVVRLKSENKVDWTAFELYLFDYDSQNRLLKRRIYKVSDTDSSLVSKETNSYSVPSLQYQSIALDAVSGVEIEEDKSFRVNDYMTQNFLWKKDGVLNEKVVVTYKYNDDKLAVVDYLCIFRSDTVMNYRCRYYSPSSKEQNIVWQTKVDSGWCDTLCTKLFFNDSNQLISEIQYSFARNLLVPIVREDHMYNSDGYKVQSVLYRWRGEYWMAVRGQLCSYADTGTILGCTYQRYANNEWNTTSKLVYDYNSFGQCEKLEVDAQFWASYPSDVVKYLQLAENLSDYSLQASSVEFEYVEEGSVDNDNIDKDNVDLQVFPNPSSDGLFYVGNLIGLEATYVVYNFGGVLLKSERLKHGVIDLSNYQSGMYLVVVKFDGKSVPLKLLIR